MTTLFSPVGTADPITRLGDGPMLHIVRHYRPDKVVLYLSQKTKGYQDRDGRYTEAISRMCAAEGYPTPSIVLKDDPDEQVFRFDGFISSFENYLVELCAESTDEPVLVNVSSGTPAMEQALVALGAFGRLQLKLLQVPTPRKDTNEKDDRENPDTYDFEWMWFYNEELRNDKAETRKSRIIEVETPHFADRVMRENIVSLVLSYDYEAAYRLACGTSCISARSKQMIAAARDRLNLDGVSSIREFYRTPMEYNPNDLLGEYLAIMEVRLAQGHWADFMRLLTPAYTQLAILTLQSSGLADQSYLKLDNRGRTTLELNWQAIEGDPTLQRLLSGANDSRSKYISNWMLKNLIEEFCSDGEAKRKLRALKSAEDNCRHPLAHNLQASNKETLERLAGIKLSQILKYLFDLYGDARSHLYSDINDAIIAKL